MEPERFAICTYCGAKIDRALNPSTEADKDLVPPIWADGWWYDEQKLHYDGCEWVQTRAHRILVSLGDE